MIKIMYIFNQTNCYELNNINYINIIKEILIDYLYFILII